jgi:hypothetical protein
MFGLFGAKKVASSVAPQVGASLQRQPALPKSLPAQATAGFPACDILHMKGDAPNVGWLPEEAVGETRRVFRVPATNGQPALGIVASTDAKKRVQVWELSSDKSPKLLQQRKTMLDPAEANWTLAYPVAMTCLPGGLVALAIGYHDPRKRDALYLYHPATNQFRRLALIEPERSNGPPFTMFETLVLGPQAMLLLYHTDAIRLSADNFAYQFDHVWLFSPQAAQGLEVLKLSVDDGNVRALAMQGKTLWLQTLDKRKKPVEAVFSLDLSKLL